MSQAYYYFAVSLPMMDFDRQAPMAMDGFLEDCERLLQTGDFELIKMVVTESDTSLTTGNAVLKKWMDFDHRFRNEMAWFRAEGASKDPLNYIRGDRYSDPSLMEVIHQASKKENLLEGEQMLDRVRWQFLEELSQGQYYNLEFILCYGLKLKILERHQAFNSPKGREIFDELKTLKIGN